MTIEDFVRDLRIEKIKKEEARKIFTSWLDENTGFVLRGEALELFDKYYIGQYDG